jgi:hypothetical protein
MSVDLNQDGIAISGSGTSVAQQMRPRFAI